MKPIGGRGKKAPYETTHVRVPIDIKPQVEELIEEFRNSQYQSSDKVDIIPKTSSSDKSQEFIKLMIEEFRNNNLVIVEKSSNNQGNSLHLSLEEAIRISTDLLSKRMTKKELVNKLLTALYQVEVNLD